MISQTNSSKEFLSITNDCSSDLVEVTHVHKSIESTWAEFDCLMESEKVVQNLLLNLSIGDVAVENFFDESDEFADIAGLISLREQTEEGKQSMREARQWARGALYGDEVSIKVLRLERGMSQKDLAVAMGTDQAAVSRWESGKGNLQTSTVLSLAKVLGVNSETIWGIAESMYLKGGVDA